MPETVSIGTNEMNDLHFIDYDAKIMLSDTVGMRPDCELAHRRLCDVVWANGRPPLNDDGALMIIARSDSKNWQRIKSELLQKGWFVENGKFTHKGCLITMAKCRERYEKKLASARTGASARWKTGLPTQCDRIASDADAPDVRSHCESQSQSHSKTTSAPGAVNGLKKERSPAQTNAWRIKSLCDRFKILWLARYKSIFPTSDYQVTGPDSSHLATFLKSATKTPAELVEIASSAWVFKSQKSFSHCSNSQSISYFCRWFNPIDHELSNKTAQSGNPQNSRNTIDRNAGTLNKPSDYAGITEA